MKISQVLLMLVGIALLVAGAEFLVRGASSLATRLGVPSLTVGLTVVAFGTSAPEFAVSVRSGIVGEGDIALGNVVGSNIVNILFILGLSAVISGLTIASRIVRLDVPLLLGVTLVVLLMSLDGSISRIEGAVLFAGIIAYTGWLLRAARRESAEVTAEADKAMGEIEGAAAEAPMWRLLSLVVGGLVLLVAGAQMLVTSASDFAEAAGVSRMVIGLTIVAVGTSLPELATSVMAAWRGERDIAVGNVIGSSIFNILAVLGMTGIVSDGGAPVISSALRLDYPVMIAATLVLLPIFWNGFEIKRWEGLVLMFFYAVYVTYLVVDATDHAATGTVAMFAAVAVPLAALPLCVAGFQGWRRHRRAAV